MRPMPRVEDREVFPHTTGFAPTPRSSIVETIRSLSNEFRQRCRPALPPRPEHN